MRPHTDPPHDTAVGIEGADVSSSLRATELVRHPDAAARVQARWSDLRAAVERLHAATRPRFVSTVLLLGGTLAALTAAFAWLDP